MLDVTCHRNFETTYLKDSEEGGDKFMKITAEIPFHCPFRNQIPN
jgi:hypothetical protein